MDRTVELRRRLRTTNLRLVLLLLPFSRRTPQPFPALPAPARPCLARWSPPLGDYQ